MGGFLIREIMSRRVTAINLKKELLKSDANAVMDIIHFSLSCNTSIDFSKLIERLKNLIGFSHGRCGAGDCSKFKTQKMDCFNMLMGYPETWENRYAQEEYFANDKVAQAGLQNPGLICWSNEIRIDGFSQEMNKKHLRMMDEASCFGIDKIWLYSVQARTFTERVFISLAGETIEKNWQSEMILNNTMPHLSQTLKRLLFYQSEQYAKLSPRESEILSWLAVGKTAWEISVILNISSKTVEFHKGNILKKLDAVNTQQAIAVAFSIGAISW